MGQVLIQIVVDNQGGGAGRPRGGPAAPVGLPLLTP